jgi:hypothetical protein
LRIFTGSEITVFGTIPSGNGEKIRVDFQVDERSPVLSTHKAETGRPVDDEVWFKAGPFLDAEGAHTLVIRYQRLDGKEIMSSIRLARGRRSPV